MGKRLYKTYRDLSNIVVRVSNGTDAGKAHAILVNAHLDSTLPSPGAADDALPCGVMLEAFRVMTQTPGWSPHHAIVFREWTLECMCPTSLSSADRGHQCSTMPKSLCKTVLIYILPRTPLLQAFGRSSTLRLLVPQVPNCFSKPRRNK